MATNSNNGGKSDQHLENNNIEQQQQITKELKTAIVTEYTTAVNNLLSNNCGLPLSPPPPPADEAVAPTTIIQSSKATDGLPLIVESVNSPLPAEQESPTATPNPVLSASGQTAAANPTDNQYFFEDEVFRIDKKGHVKFGLVIETSETTYSGDEDEDYDDMLSKGDVRVAWYPEGKEEVQSEDAVALADRTLMPGDVVRRLVPGNNTQCGYCRDISMHADVKVLGTKYVIKNVMTERLRPINTWQRDSAVCLDSWVGSTKDVEEKAVLRSSTGMRVEISSNHFYGFTDFNSRNAHGIFNPHVFYPGNVIVGRLPALDHVKVLTPNIPIQKNKKGKPLKGKYTIESVETDSVWVHWQCKALSEENNMDTSVLEQPNACVTGEDLKRLKRLNLFESCMVQISDRSYLKFSKCDTYVKKSQWEKEQAAKYKVSLAQMQKQEHQCTTTNSTNSHHIEKPKKKFNLFDIDSKSAKPKKSALKADKLSNANSKDKATPHEPTMSENGTANLHNRKTFKSSITDTDWVTDEEDEDDDEEEDDDEACFNDEFDEDDVVSTTTCSTPSPHHSPKHSKRRLLRKKGKSAVKQQANSLMAPHFAPKDGEELITEALLVYSTATVVWQDGTIESGIPSTQLYPIHHLDDHEFFPGDFVVSNKEDADTSYRDYGVIQKVDHHGRTALVKWFTTYTSAAEPRPSCNGETEESVYDLKDHPDFQYGPGKMVIRVANFVGDDANCTAGQIIDNYIEGRSKVWWVDGHISMCWPQDLFEVGQYDHADWGHESEDSWETESENSELGCSTPVVSVEKSHIITNIERTSVAIGRLEEIFNINPTLQNADVMRRLLNVYKGCRYLDRLLNTTFFHEKNFMGLIQRVRKGGTQTVGERAQDRKNRLFSYAQTTSPNSKQQQLQQQIAAHAHPPHQQSHYQAIITLDNANRQQKSTLTAPSNILAHLVANGTISAMSKEYAPKILFNISSTPCKAAASSLSNVPETVVSSGSTTATGGVGVGGDGGGGSGPSAMLQPLPKPKYAATLNAAPALGVTAFAACDKSDNTKLAANTSATSADEAQTAGAHNSSNVDDNSVLLSDSGTRNDSALTQQKNIAAQNSQLLNSAMTNIEKAFEKTFQLRGTIASQDDSGNYSRNENCDGSSTSYASYSDLTNADANGSLVKVNDDQKSVSCSSIELHEDAAPEMVCVRLCVLLKEQLVKCTQLIRDIHFKDDKINISRVFNFDDSMDVGDDANAAGEASLDVNTAAEEEKQEQEAAVEDDEELKNNKNNDSTAQETKQPLNLAAISDETVVCTAVETNGEQSSAAETDTSIAAACEAPNAFNVAAECFQVVPHAPAGHKFECSTFQPNNAQQYYKAVQREHRLLKNALPPGVWVRVFEDRMDLLSVMIEGPKKTPYEDGLFFFDIQLGREYPKSPPLCHYISYCSDRLNPNLYEDGKVCVSLLGTWAGRDSEVWGHNSTLLQVIVSIQGLILVAEPYFNEAGYEKQKGSLQGSENSRMYNEMVIIKMVQSSMKLIQQPPQLFRAEIYEHWKNNGYAMYERIKGWMELSQLMQKTADKVAITSNGTPQGESVEPNPTTMTATDHTSQYAPPDFPLLPASRGFCLTLAGLLETFKAKLATLNEMVERGSEEMSLEMEDTTAAMSKA